MDDSTRGNLTHRFNQYSDYAYYFITFGGIQGKRVQTSNIPGNSVEVFNTFDEYVFHEKDSLSLNQAGKQWGGEDFRVEPNQSFVLNGNAPVAGDFVGKYRMIGKGAGGVSFNVSINGVSFPPANMSSGDFSVRYENHLLTGVSGSSFTFNINVSNASNPGAFVLLDYLEVDYEASLTFNGSQMQFRKLQNINDGNVYGFALSGPQKVWNISDITTATNVANTGGVYKYQSTDPNFLNEFIAFNDAAAFTEVNFVGQVANQNIRALKDIEYAIVVHPNFLSEATRLANFRIQNDGVKVAVVTTEQVYNEFSSGAQDISAIRDFFKHLRDTGSPLKYALLFGGASYDYKDRIQNNSNFVPAYISYNSSGIDNSFVTDDYFTMLDNTDTILQNNNRRVPVEFDVHKASQMDIAVGRIPAHSVAEAKVMVDKILAYYEKLPGQGTSLEIGRHVFYWW